MKFLPAFALLPEGGIACISMTSRVNNGRSTSPLCVLVNLYFLMTCTV